MVSGKNYGKITKKVIFCKPKNVGKIVRMVKFLSSRVKIVGKSEWGTISIPHWLSDKLFGRGDKNW